ncbi:hypothetical protein RJT34_13719 [Clitoria ternatea]|uniref:Uncharacterized protein n=1 Tax=Clitoria ternatea TaxID=43366 RepID=A0AAN9PMJ0_CLITE
MIIEVLHINCGWVQEESAVIQNGESGVKHGKCVVWGQQKVFPATETGIHVGVSVTNPIPHTHFPSHYVNSNSHKKSFKLKYHMSGAAHQTPYNIPRAYVTPTTTPNQAPPHPHTPKHYCIVTITASLFKLKL